MSLRLQSRAPSWAREDIVTNRALRPSVGDAIFAMASVFGAKVAMAIPRLLAVLKVALVLLISMRIRPRALELF